MLSLICALLASFVTWALLAWLTKPIYAWLPATIVFGGTYFLLARYHGKKVEALMKHVMSQIEQQRIDHGINILRGGYKDARWVFLLRGQIDGQIGTLYYLEKKFDEALPMLEKAWIRHWVAKGMLASYWFRHHKPELANEILDKAIAASKKEPLLYGLKAWMQVKLKDRDGARATLTAGKERAPSNEAITVNLVRLQNGEDLKMHLFGEAWWQFHLEKPSQRAMMKLSGQSTRAAKGAKKSLYR